MPRYFFYPKIAQTRCAAWTLWGIKNPASAYAVRDSRGERGIRTPGGVTLNSFQDYRIRPLCHLSNKNPLISLGDANVKLFLAPQTTLCLFFCLSSYKLLL
jgi:hypothetical protein